MRIPDATISFTPGWYPDGVAGQVRYWDGEQWTSEVAPSAPPQYACPQEPHPGSLAPPMASRSVARYEIPRVGWVAIIASAAALVGSFLPWVSMLWIFGKIELSGFDGGDGKITAVAAVAAIVLGYVGLSSRSKPAVITAAVAALGGFGVAIYDFANVSNSIASMDSEAATATVGYGLYGCLVGFAISAICLLVAIKDPQP